MKKIAASNYLLLLLVGAALLAVASCFSPPRLDDEPIQVDVYKLATCGCCRPWIRYLESNGFEVQAHDVSDPEIIAIKQQHGVPIDLKGCHTAIVDDYVIEGHVSTEEIFRLLNEKPNIRGLIVTGMPKGSPGMERPDPEKYDVLALDHDGATSVYATHDPSSNTQSAPH